MAKYRLLADHYVKNVLLPAGSIVSDTGEGAELPNGYVPTPNMDPLDADAVIKFHAAGPQLPGPIISRWTGATVAPPVTKWIPDPSAPLGNPGNQYSLSGLGVGLPASSLA
jgi:hypothetical protein